MRAVVFRVERLPLFEQGQDRFQFLAHLGRGHKHAGVFLRLGDGEFGRGLEVHERHAAHVVILVVLKDGVGVVGVGELTHCCYSL